MSIFKTPAADPKYFGASYPQKATDKFQYPFWCMLHELNSLCVGLKFDNF
jgi:hypothetical protein